MIAVSTPRRRWVGATVTQVIAGAGHDGARNGQRAAVDARRGHHPVAVEQAERAVQLGDGWRGVEVGLGGRLAEGPGHGLERGRPLLGGRGAEAGGRSSATHGCLPGGSDVRPATSPGGRDRGSRTVVVLWCADRTHRPSRSVPRDQRGHRPDRPARSAAARAPPRADRVLLPDARLVVRRRGRGAGDDGARLARARRLRGPVGAALVAVPDRHQRLPRPALRPAAPGAADGPVRLAVAAGRALAGRGAARARRGWSRCSTGR